jgi:hypothetical protein
MKPASQAISNLQEKCWLGLRQSDWFIGSASVLM